MRERCFSEFTRSYDLPGNLEKGMFPFLFNKPENYHTTRTGLPSKRYYMPGSMKPKKRREFERWHDSQRDVVFDFDRVRESWKATRMSQLVGNRRLL